MSCLIYNRIVTGLVPGLVFTPPYHLYHPHSPSTFACTFTSNILHYIVNVYVFGIELWIYFPAQFS